MADPDHLQMLRDRPPLNAVRGRERLPEPAQGLYRAEIAGGEIAGRDDFFDALAAALALPDWFGRNWDALADVLSDLSWLGEDDVVLVVSDAQRMLERAPKASAHLLSAWTDAAIAQSGRGRSLRLFLVLGE